MASLILVNTGLVNGLLPDRIKSWYLTNSNCLLDSYWDIAVKSIALAEVNIRCMGVHRTRNDGRLSRFLIFVMVSRYFIRTRWRHQMETFSVSLALCVGKSPVTVNSPLKGQWRGALMFSLICAWIKGWVNNREAGDLRRYRVHYDVTAMNHQFLFTGTPVIMKYFG